MLHARRMSSSNRFLEVSSSFEPWRRGRPDPTGYRDVEAAYRISLKSLARRYLELHDEIADLTLFDAAFYGGLEQFAQEVTVAEAAMPVLGEC